jgi:2-polyprenyl-3-methyl-5-hydroxy-6-metoxy-1,4-benzoquinol methylase
MLTRKMNLVNRYVDGQNRKLLDIGCGTGYFLQAAKERGFTVVGIEKNDLARTHAITRFGLEVKDENSFFDIADTSFNVITLWHVLEHLEKLNESLERINGILTPDGTVVIALPNHNAYDAHFYQTFWAAYDLPRHLWHFSPDTVEKLLNKHHLKIIAIHRMPLDAFYISMLSEKYKGSNLWVQYGRAFRVGATGFLRSLRNPEQSSSLIYIVKKK